MNALQLTYATAKAVYEIASEACAAEQAPIEAAFDAGEITEAAADEACDRIAARYGVERLRLALRDAENAMCHGIHQKAMTSRDRKIQPLKRAFAMTGVTFEDLLGSYATRAKLIDLCFRVEV